MCVILGIMLSILIDTLEPIPPVQSHHWHDMFADIRTGKVSLWRGLLFLQSKIVFPTLFTIYLILLVIQKVKIVTPEWQSYASSAIETLQLLWVTLISAILANFSGLPDNAYENTHHSKLNNSFTLILICLLAYVGMWAIFVEIAKIGRVAYFISLSVGVLIALVSAMILTEEVGENKAETKTNPLSSPSSTI